MKPFFDNIIKDIEVELTEEFDRNFERKAFFDQHWKETSHTNGKGSLMMRTGDLRKSISKATVVNGQIHWSSSLPYASLHNEGGTIEVTQAMKSFFWAMYYKSLGAITTKKNGGTSNSQRNVKLTGEAAKWRAMALTKVGTKWKIEKRQFIGDHPVVHQRIEVVLDKNLKELNDYILNQFKQK